MDPISHAINSVITVGVLPSSDPTRMRVAAIPRRAVQPAATFVSVLGNMDVEIIHVGPGDAALLDRVADDVFDAPIDPARLAVYLASAGHILLVARVDGEVVAQLGAVIHYHPDQPTELYIDNLGVAAKLQRRGIARRMLQRLFELGRAAGCEEAWVGTEHDNEPARKLYEDLGETKADPFVLYLYEL
jgi:aminoglycoside 6'-N-acetyltransferase I